MTRLAGAHVLVTGGSQGIGLETARLCRLRGARVSLLARTASTLEQAARSLGPDVATIAADVTDPAGLGRAVEALVARSGPVKVLVASAGGAEPRLLLDSDDDALRRALELNLHGAVSAVRAVLPGMLAGRRGHIVLVSSVAALLGVPGYGAYAPAKAALRSVADVLEAEHGDDGLRVTVVYPPDTLTPGYAREEVGKPAETSAVSALASPVSADVVARALVRGVERDRRTVTTDTGTALLAALPGPSGPVVRWVVRRAVRRARR